MDAFDNEREEPHGQASATHDQNSGAGLTFLPTLELWFEPTKAKNEVS